MLHHITAYNIPEDILYITGNNRRYVETEWYMIRRSSHIIRLWPLNLITDYLKWNGGSIYEEGLILNWSGF